MKIDFNLIVLFHLLVIVQGFTTGVLLLSRNRLEGQNFWLDALVISTTAQVVNRFFISSGIYQTYRGLYFFHFSTRGAMVLFFIFMFNHVLINTLH